MYCKAEGLSCNLMQEVKGKNELGGHYSLKATLFFYPSQASIRAFQMDLKEPKSGTCGGMNYNLAKIPKAKNASSTP